MSEWNDLAVVFEKYARQAEADSDKGEEIRRAAREADFAVRQIVTTLQSIHHAKDLNSAVPPENSFFAPLQASFSAIQKTIPANMYYRYHSIFKSALQQGCFAAALVVFLRRRTLITLSEACEILQLAPPNDFESAEEGEMQRGDLLKLDVEDFLLGLCSLSNELSRLAVNRVTKDDFVTPKEIHDFLSDLYSAFRVLNLKNDMLRKRFDSIKYDVKKVEEVAYDIRIRKLDAPSV
eukprot:Rmarinus@m.20151